MNDDYGVPIISAIVCTYNRSKLLYFCLQSLAKQTLDVGLFEILVIDNNSTDDTRTVVAEFSGRLHNLRLISETVQGLAAARNRGWQEARGKFVAYIDDDASATPKWLELILWSFQNVQPPPVAVGGEIRPVYEAPPPHWFTDDFEIRSWGDSPTFISLPRLPFGFSGSNMAFQRQILESYCGFNVSYGMHGSKIRLGEETELFYRMHKEVPFFWFDPSILVFHWTPVRNMKVSYRVKRAFCAGRSHAAIFGRGILSKENVFELLSFCKTILCSPLRLAQRNGLRRTAAVRIIQDLAYSLGLLLGRH
jgi:glycosyltransferase involved in cell wall biosynthesis